MLKAHFSPNYLEAGLDEAGRGCLAGPVVAAAVVLPRGYADEHLNDSKQLSETKRMTLRQQIEADAEAWAVGIVSHEEIDEINILNASFLAMHRALDQLEVTPELLLIDGNRFKTYRDIPHECVIKGDGKFMSIAAASILAKTYRDEFMRELAIEYPYYGWERNAGYPTKQHREAIKEFGVNKYHRKSFNLLPRQTELFN